MSMSETSATETIDYERVTRSLELKLQLLEYGLALPRDDDAIARTRALRKEMRSRLIKAANAAA
jgi:hypothetical protein